LVGGGRYDKLISIFDNKKDVPAIGFAIGIERIMPLVKMPEQIREGIYLGAMSEDAVERLFDLATEKRKETKVTVEYNSKGFKSHMKGVDKAKARYAVLIGENELANDTVWMKDLESKEETTLPMHVFKASL